jgi:lycopene beta-cyclase
MNKPLQSQFAFIIAGGGMAGLSLAYYLSKSQLGDLPILVIDQFPKNKNDKTWCFWSDQEEEFDKVAEKKWDSLWFHSQTNQSKLLNINPFQYRKINSVDWYKEVYSALANKPNIQFLEAKIQSFSYRGLDVNVSTDQGDFCASKKVFDSVSAFTCDFDNPKHIKQHFLGWTIESHFPIFKKESADLFDFRVAFGLECEFMYVLPTSSKKALFEYTFFSGNLREKTYYRDKLKAYLLAYYGFGEDDYDLLEEEYGVIPMRPMEGKPQNLHDKIIKIGTAGGFVKSTTGYSFLRTQHVLKELVVNLETKKHKAPILKDLRFKKWLDKVFLQVFIDQKIAGSKIFEALFFKNSPQKMLRFLEEKTSLREDLSLMLTVPTYPFLAAAIKLFMNGNKLP